MFAILSILLATGGYTPAKKPVKIIEPEVFQTATSLVNDLKMGEEVRRTINGKKYLFVAEPHYHGPGERGPQGWHRGITVYEGE
jgi:hypothetical protein